DRTRTWFAAPKAVRPSRRQSDHTRRFRPGCELLEDRTVLSTASSITASFNGTAIPAGDTIWFDAAFTASGLPKAAAATVHVENGVITFTASGTTYNVAVPNGVIVFTPAASSASASLDPTDHHWQGGVPSNGVG